MKQCSELPQIPHLPRRASRKVSRFRGVLVGFGRERLFLMPVVLALGDVCGPISACDHLALVRREAGVARVVQHSEHALHVPRFRALPADQRFRLPGWLR